MLFKTQRRESMTIIYPFSRTILTSSLTVESGTLPTVHATHSLRQIQMEAKPTVTQPVVVLSPLWPRGVKILDHGLVQTPMGHHFPRTTPPPIATAVQKTLGSL
jgi:hypothetical protein